MKPYTGETVREALSALGVTLHSPSEYDEVAIRLGAIVETIISLMGEMHDDPEALLPVPRRIREGL